MNPQKRPEFKPAVNAIWTSFISTILTTQTGPKFYQEKIIFLIQIHTYERERKGFKEKSIANR